MTRLPLASHRLSLLLRFKATWNIFTAIPLSSDAIVSVVGTAPNAIAQAAYTQVSFNFTGALTTNGSVYGYYVTNTAGQVIFAERATAPYIPANNGDALLLTPIFKLSSGTPS